MEFLGKIIKSLIRNKEAECNVPSLGHTNVVLSLMLANISWNRFGEQDKQNRTYQFSKMVFSRQANKFLFNFYAEWILNPWHLIFRGDLIIKLNYMAITYQILSNSFPKQIWFQTELVNFNGSFMWLLGLLLVFCLARWPNEL